LKSLHTREKFLTFLLVTALSSSCAVPTLDRGNAETAATLVPVRATSNAIEAMTVPGDGSLVRLGRIAVSSRSYAMNSFEIPHVLPRKAVLHKTQTALLGSLERAVR
jgi:hypothetical protein